MAFINHARSSALVDEAVVPSDVPVWPNVHFKIPFNPAICAAGSPMDTRLRQEQVEVSQNMTAIFVATSFCACAMFDAVSGSAQGEGWLHGSSDAPIFDVCGRYQLVCS